MDNKTVTYKCPNCGGELVWNPEKKAFDCQWCSSDFPEGTVKSFAEENGADAEKFRAEEQFAEDTDVYICKSCGAEIICDHNTAASFCYYCHNPVALSGRLTGAYRPEMILPFNYSRRQAEAAFKAYCLRKWFLPSDFLSESQLEKITGLYVPFWLADCEIDMKVVGQGEKINTIMHHGSTEIITSVFRLERGATMSYMGIPADGSEKIEDTLMDAIEPFDYTALRNFEMSYLSGYYCDKYDVDKGQVVHRIRSRIEESAEDVMRKEMAGYENITIRSKDLRINSTKWHYMMLPVWFMTYKHHGKIYSFAMNGQTGKIAGVFPVSRFKAAAAGILTAVAVGIAAYLIGGVVL